ncbi:membrane or secreted protein [Pedobacter sp. MW01-1-1]|uniref:membrane or secreted protein n=1 Tax=Pedobacter sp. MW01-1-1 TaxID=3383027 RepID=UPI003FEE9973
MILWSVRRLHRVQHAKLCVKDDSARRKAKTNKHIGLIVVHLFMILTKNNSLFIGFILASISVFAQNKQGIYVDKAGVIRWEKDKKEATFFGVNYTAPFAYGNRAITRVGQSAEQAIKDDVYHFARLGFDAFRVHVWDQEISDVNGNLIENEHLRLFDFLIAELKKRKIKTLVTPIAFWGNGYPEQDEKTGSFSNVFGKDKALVEEAAIKAQENYLQQFFKHKNPYTGLTYQQDSDILGTEVNNEPHHSGAKALTTDYINRMVVAIKSAGWTKPIFYNISESPWYADAVVKANVQGHSFQWYPTGLVSGHTLQGNYLPNVAKYQIPFDTIPAFKNRAKMVYEFDAGDVMQPIMYPAMAKSFRAAGFQWATQFAYDPMATAYANTEYQTHYLNLAYTPAKAISMLIAARVFHQSKRLEQSDDLHAFDSFRIDYTSALSEMNSPQEFCYTNSTFSEPVASRQLKHIAGLGSSIVVQYEGKGAYFLDKLEDGLWRLEVMPDALHIRDPFERASPSKEVTRINWATWPMAINLHDLGTNFSIQGLNDGNQVTAFADNTHFTISPGTYLLSKKNLHSNLSAKSRYQNIILGEFVAPKASTEAVYVKHYPFATLTETVPFRVQAEIANLSTGDSVFVQLNTANRGRFFPMKMSIPYCFVAEIPGDFVKNGLLKYQIIVQKQDGSYITFPANEKTNPFAWDKLEQASYQSYVAGKNAFLEIFNPAADGDKINAYTPDWKENKINYTSDINPEQLNLTLSIGKPKANEIMGFQSFFGDKLVGRKSELNRFKTLVVKLKANTENTKVKIGLIDTDAHFFSAEIVANTTFKTIEIPLEQLKNDRQLLLPRPYPGFLPLYFQHTNKGVFDLKNTEKIELTFGYEATANPLAISVESIYLQ